MTYDATPAAATPRDIFTSSGLYVIYHKATLAPHVRAVHCGTSPWYYAPVGESITPPWSGCYSTAAEALEAADAECFSADFDALLDPR